MLHISLKPDVIFRIGIFPITNTLLTGFLLISGFFLLSLKFYKKSSSQSFSVIVFITRSVLIALNKLFESVLEDKAKHFFPLLTALFLYILLSNWLGLVPGVGSITFSAKTLKNHQINSQNQHENEKDSHHTSAVPLLKGSTADLNTTLALAILMMSIIQYYGIKYCGLKGYLSKFISFANPMAFFTGILEIISEFSKIISFAFRLFGNIFAGEVLLAVIAFLVPVLASFPFLLLELFVGFIQALVFVMLSAVFLQVATAKHH